VRLLLDTHTYLWVVVQPERLSPEAHRLVADPANDLLLSIASLWEATIKIATGKLQVPGQTIAFFLQELARFHIDLLPIQPDHPRVLETIPSLHRDPFDRILLSQSIAEQMPSSPKTQNSVNITRTSSGKAPIDSQLWGLSVGKLEKAAVLRRPLRTVPNPTLRKLVMRADPLTNL